MSPVASLVASPNLSAAIHHDIVQSEIEGGVHLGDLPPGATLEISTRHHVYNIVKTGGLNARISGHPQYCAEPVEVLIGGANWGGSMIKPGYIGRGMRLEFWHPEHKLITTSKVLDIRQTS